MRYIITERDKSLLLQSEVNYKYRLYVLDKDEKIVDTLEGLSSIGSYNIDADSTIRRTISFVLELDSTYSSTHIEEKIETWIGYDFKMQIGIYSIRDDDYVWYECGTYSITAANTSYDAVTNSLSTELGDWFIKLNGTRNGQIGGAPTILIPIEDDSGIITLRRATVDILRENGIKKYIVQDLGEFYGMPTYNPDYLEYRRNYPNWNQLPYELEYSAGCMVADILIDIRDLYPNYEMYYDIFNNFCFNVIPSCENDIVTVTNDFLQQILLGEGSESVTYDISSIKNITEVFGKVYDVDRFCDEGVTVSSNVYNISFEGYDEGKYERGDIIAFIAPSDSLASPRLRINELTAIPIYVEGKTEYIEAGTLKANELYCFKIVYRNDEPVADYLGAYQPHAICVLTNNENDLVYTKEYFKKKYNCDHIIFRVEEYNPFSVQKLGEILDVKSGDEFDNILSDSVALENAIYYNKKASTFNDIVTISTIMIPWLDVNTKVSYQKKQETEVHEYIVKSISNDLGSNTSSITLHRFYPLYFVE